MTAAAALPHVDAVLSALSGAGLTASLGGAPPGQAPPYIAVYPDGGRSLPGDLADPLSLYQGTVQLTCVGQTAEQALSVSDRARAALSVPLTVQGRSGWRPEELGGLPVRRDDDVTPPLYYVPVQYRLRSSPT